MPYPPAARVRVNTTDPTAAEVNNKRRAVGDVHRQHADGR